jgi:uncharacterized protein (TIGR03437 family)
MGKRFKIIRFLVVLEAAKGFAQTGPTLVGTGYVPALPSGISPGQIVRLQVAGLKSILPRQDGSHGPRFQRAASVPLPTTLAGISVTVRQFVRRFTSSTPVPLELRKAALVSVQQLDLCRADATTPDCITTLITAQMPVELQFNNVGNPFYSTEIVISEAGTDSRPFEVGVGDDQIHVVTDCDQGTWHQSSCRSIVAHPDGSLVSARSPAVAGETVVIYAWGLGRTTPTVKTGEIAPTPAPYSELFGSLGAKVRFDFSPNASPARTNEGEWVKAFLTPGQVGLYQINVQLPATFPPLRPCEEPLLKSNLTINLSGVWSTDGASICVQPEQ